MLFRLIKSKGSLPSKLPNLLASGCKTLIITDKDSEIELLFNLQNIGTVINSWNFTIILKTIQSILSKDIDVVFQKEIAKELFTIDKMIYKILN
jgi:colanic acid biosynthesis glycosyl transferase WcaI